MRLVIDTNILNRTALVSAGQADLLITGDQRDLLGITRDKGTRIVTVRDFLTLNRRLP